MPRKRKSTRVAVTALAEITFPSGETLSTYVANMSLEGLGLYVKKPIDAGTEIAVKLTYHDESGALKTKTVKGQVKWAYNGFYALGVALQGMDLKEHDDLLQYIRWIDEQNQT